MRSLCGIFARFVQFRVYTFTECSNQNLDTGPKSRIVDPQVRGSGPLLRSLSLSLWHKKALSKDCFLQACSRKGSDLETTRDTTTAAAMFYALEFILRDHFYISEPRERGPTHLPPDKGEPRVRLCTPPKK